MECNKDEAIKAKMIAEKKWDKNDFVGAKKFAQKAQTLYPGIDGILQLLDSLDVYISSESKVNGESDWYKVLDVNPSDDHKTIYKRYKDLAFKLHSDKNKSVTADGAFKIVQEAWGLLSDKDKRSAYNQRRNSGSSPNVNVDHDYSANKSTSNPKNCKSTETTQTSPTPAAHESDKFWTICHRCKLCYEFLKAYLNHNIVCPICYMSFLATEMVVPTSSIQPVVEVAYPSGSTPVAHDSDKFWTICHGCKMRYVCLKTYLNHFIRCSNCNMPFLAGEMAFPTSFILPVVQETYPFGPSSNAQIPHPGYYYTQPAAPVTGWAPWSFGSHISNAPMAPSMGHTQNVAPYAGWAPSSFTQPVAQNTGWAPWSFGSHISNAPMAPSMGHTQNVAPYAGWAPSSFTQPVAQNTGWAPWSFGSHISNAPTAPSMGHTQHIFPHAGWASSSSTQPVAQNTGWADAQMSRSMVHTQHVAPHAGWAPSSSTEPAAQNTRWADAQMSLSMGHTQHVAPYAGLAPSGSTEPVAQNTRWAPLSFDSFEQMAPRMDYTQFDRQNAPTELANVPNTGSLQEISQMGRNWVSWFKSKLF